MCGVRSIRTPSHITKVSSLETSLEIFLRGTESTTGYFVSAFNESVIHPEGAIAVKWPFAKQQRTMKRCY